MCLDIQHRAPHLGVKQQTQDTSSTGRNRADAEEGRRLLRKNNSILREKTDELLAPLGGRWNCFLIV